MERRAPELRDVDSLTESADEKNRDIARGNVSNHLANERTYLAWLRTGIATIGLGFVVARFGLVIRELTGISLPETAFHLSSIIGITLTIAGGLMVLLAFNRFTRNQERIRAGTYEPTSGAERLLSFTIFVIALLLVVYLFLTL